MLAGDDEQSVAAAAHAGSAIASAMRAITTRAGVPTLSRRAKAWLALLLADAVGVRWRGALSARFFACLADTHSLGRAQTPPPVSSHSTTLVTMHCCRESESC